MRSEPDIAILRHFPSAGLLEAASSNRSSKKTERRRQCQDLILEKQNKTTNVQCKSALQNARPFTALPIACILQWPEGRKGGGWGAAGHWKNVPARALPGRWSRPVGPTVHSRSGFAAEPSLDR